MTCPICGKAVTPRDRFMPFCSQRCKLIDLGNWASENYVISTPRNPGDADPSENPGREPLDEFDELEHEAAGE